MKYLSYIFIFVIGFGSGAGVLYWVNISGQEDEITEEKGSFEVEEKLIVSNINQKESKVKKIKNEKEIPEKIEPIEEVDTIEVDSVYQDSLFSEMESDDSLEIELAAIDLDNEEIVVKKEKLIMSKRFKLNYLDVEERNIADSLLEENMGVRKTKKKEITVEFWQSPLSSKGYLYNNHKVKLYGLDVQHNYKFFIKEKELYLETPIEIYHLKTTDEFQSFIFASKDTFK